MILVLASARSQVGSFLEALLLVYSIIIIAYIFSSMFLNLGGRVPYSGWSRSLLDFLRDVSEPYLSIFRRFIPPIGPLDLSPMIGLFVLWIVGGFIVSLVSG